MEPLGTVLGSVLAVPAVLVLHLGLVPVMAQQSELQVGVAGQTVTLSCRGIPHDTGVTWRYYRLVVRQFKSNHLRGKAAMTDRSEISSTSKHLKVWGLKLSDAGVYTCDSGSRTVSISLHVFQLTISLDGHFLPKEVPELILMQNSSHPLPHLSITLFDSNNHTVTPQLQNKTPQKYILMLKQLKATDNGTWTCHVHSDSPLIDHNITFDVKVLGFQNPDLERKYAAVDSTVTLSWRLNFQKVKWQEGFTGQLSWKQKESATAHELLDFNVTARGEQHETKKSSPLRFEIPESKPQSAIEVKIPKVHFSHSGQYWCRLAYSRRYTQSQIELLVMKVSADPAGPLPSRAEVTLTCQVSSPLPPNAHLLWERVNGTQVDVKKSKQHEMEVEVNVSAAGLWNCHLMEDNERKISLHYLVEEAPGWISYMAIGASVGGSILVFGLACLCIINGISWQRRRQRAKRMARARQYLLENKTCQCQHQLNK
ncbi:T-cell surface glycoprotein CD4-like [Falco naumanni]|uniref:T-cell surface glycoprotein CD4-like n=1 Tax=Falco naumanni TaxID=148594 RepID=UPI001ADDEA87|nr:T-cell surface glycoprotein CD4-like [Falco naumanni]